MDRSTLDELLELYAGNRRLFYYDKDEYARYLLARQVEGHPLSLAKIRQSHWMRLLERPAIKTALGQWGDGQLSYQRLELLRSANPLPFRITFSEWGEAKHYPHNYNQTSRPGYNLVLQLNFANEHNRVYQQTVENKLGWHPFHYACHPAQADQEYTLAWARIDLSDNLEEALLEEIQSDWWRAASTEIIRRKHRKRDVNGKWQEWTEARSRHQLDVKTYEAYLNGNLKAYGKLWSEAILTATLQFLWEEIGVSKVFYHSYETGCKLKNCQPPRSLYTQLPKRFCFTQSENAPQFIERSLRRLPAKFRKKASFWTI